MTASAFKDRMPGAAMAKWLSVVGIGEDGITGLGSQARRRIEAAEFVFGGRRHLRHAAALIRGESRAWPSPFEGVVAQILALRGRAVCVLASGDPMHFGIGALLAREIDVTEMTVLPGPSAFGLAAARLGWALQDCDAISLHGRSIERIRPLLHPGRRVLAVTSDGDAPARIAGLITADGFGASRFIVLEALGGTHERVRSFRAAAVGEARFDDLNVVAIEVEPGAEAR
ncbi:MAG: precorrin-6y C5,15-methyltransferase (decarboxylating) subunit CbiE, partial [Stellaceae bacterium]